MLDVLAVSFQFLCTRRNRPPKLQMGGSTFSSPWYCTGVLRTQGLRSPKYSYYLTVLSFNSTPSTLYSIIHTVQLYLVTFRCYKFVSIVRVQCTEYSTTIYYLKLCQICGRKREKGTCPLSLASVGENSQRPNHKCIVVAKIKSTASPTQFPRVLPTPSTLPGTSTLSIPEFQYKDEDQPKTEEQASRVIICSCHLDMRCLVCSRPKSDSRQVFRYKHCYHNDHCCLNI
jgi:hypothetical protein